jgi:hypothetical protein
MGLSFTIAAGPRQLIHSRIRVLWDSRPYFTLSDSRRPSLSPPTTRRATVEVFDPASTRECSFMTRCGPQTEQSLERFAYFHLRLRCHGNASSPNVRCPATIYSALPVECAQRSAAQQTVTFPLSGVMSQYCISHSCFSGSLSICSLLFAVVSFVVLVTWP